MNKLSSTYYQDDSIQIINGDITELSLIYDSIDLVVTSPPYNLNIAYGSSNDYMPHDEYLKFSFDWMSKIYAAAKNDGRFCLNIPLDKNLGEHTSVYADLVTMAKSVGWRYFTTIIWQQNHLGRRTAWGSWLSPSAPYVIAPVEMIAVFYKNQWKKIGNGSSDIAKKEFLNWTNGLWQFGSQNRNEIFRGIDKKTKNHPAPFPLELPQRCIKLFSYEGDTVIDPFMGSGTTLVAAYNSNRKSIGVDIDTEYCQLALQRILNAKPFI